MRSTHNSEELEESKGNPLSFFVTPKAFSAQKGSSTSTQSRVSIRIRRANFSTCVVQDLDPNETIGSVRQKVAEKLDYSLGSMQLRSEDGRQLADSAKLADYDYQNSIFSVMIDCCGGEIPAIGFSFNSLETLVKVQFDPNGPDYRRVYPGLNFFSNCRNSGCRANGKGIFVHKGFGTFNIGQVSAEMVCPACEKEGDDSTICGFFMANWKFVGMLKKAPANGERRKENSGCANTHEYYTFAEGNNTKWRSLDITTTKLS